MPMELDTSTPTETSGEPDSTGEPPKPGSRRGAIHVRPTEPGDFPAIGRLARRVYPDDPDPWPGEYLQMQIRRFPEGQLVAIDGASGELVGMAASLRIEPDRYSWNASYVAMTDDGAFTNHDPRGQTLYGAEVMVDPSCRRRGVGSAIYAARFALARRLGVDAILAGARLPGYDRYAAMMSAEEYVARVVKGQLADPTLSFQLRHGFTVLGVVPRYVDDRPSRDHAALIEWLNPDRVELPRAA
jgi:GNAT superfamily N-acetyltransferase